MTRLQKLDRKIHHAEIKARLAEDYYHFAMVHGCIAERDRALQAGNGIKPDRRSKPAQQPDWMAYVTPLHQHKRELEEKVLHKKAELDKAQQELRDYLATIRKLMTEGNT